jgi:hypothetical protein
MTFAAVYLIITLKSELIDDKKILLPKEKEQKIKKKQRKVNNTMGSVESRDPNSRIAREIEGQMEKDKFTLDIFDIIQEYNKLEKEGKLEEAKDKFKKSIEEKTEQLKR